MSMSPRLLRPRQSGFDPRSISGLALWLDASDGATLFQDAAATTPATASNDPVGAWLDKSGNGRHATQATAGSRPFFTSAWKTSGRAVRFTASTQALNLNATWSNLGDNAAKTITEFYVLQWPTGSNQAFVQEPSAINGHKIFPYFSNSQSYYDAGSESSARVFGNVGPAITGGVVITGVRNGGTVTLFHGETQIATRADATGDLFGGSAGNAVRFAGASGGDAFLAASVVYSRALSASEQRRVRLYLSVRHGIPVPPTVSNADAQDWINRVYSNGGTVSASTASAMDTFCNSINAAGIRDRFYRLNLFCGTGLNAALVPLYRGPSLGGTQYGNSIDTNVGPFVSGDYAETGASAGLVGNGTSKYLNTGLKADALPSADRHLSVTVDAGLLGAGSKYALGADNFGGAGNFFWGIMTSPTAGNMLVRAQASAANSSSFAVTGRPQITLSGNGSAPAYLNGSLAVTGPSGAFTAPALDIYALGLNRNGSTIDAYGGRVQSYSIGLGMTAAQAAAYYTAMQAFQTALSRA